VLISLRKYKEEAVCDVIPMEATHILPGRLWQFDKQTLHDGLIHNISFLHEGIRSFFVLSHLNKRERME